MKLFGGRWNVEAAELLVGNRRGYGEFHGRVEDLEARFILGILKK